MDVVLDAVTAMAAAPDYRTALSALARAGVPHEAQWATVHVRERGGAVRQLAAAHADDALVRTLRELGRRCNPDADAAGTLPNAVADGRATLVARLDEREAARLFGCGDAPEIVADFARVGAASLIVVPPVLRGTERGALTWARGPSAPPFDGGALTLARTLVAQAGGVLDALWRLEAERQARAEAEAARQQVTGALDDLPDAFLTVDGRGRVTFVNRAAARLAGVPREAALGRTVAELFAGPIGAPLHEGSAVALREGRVVEYELFEPAGRGWLAVRAVPARGGASLYLRDVTVRRAADEERERLLAEAEAARADAEGARTTAEYANQTKSEFLASMSHELRTPLNAILGYTALLADGISGPVAPSQVPPLARVRASAQHLLALIEEILVFARLEAGTEEARLAAVDLGGLAREAAELVEPVVETHGLRFRVTAPPPGLLVHTDARKVRQILLNLLANAARFTPAGGEVALAASSADGWAQFTVHDTGVGIASEHHASVFEPFWQVEQKLTRRTGGTGLGLSVSRRLARLLGGDVTVERSAPGMGSVFAVRVPTAAQGDGGHVGDGSAA